MNPPPGMPPNFSDEQMNASINRMKQNPEMMRNMMKGQGLNVDDAQMESIMNMMNPEMFKMAQQMQQNGTFPPNMGAGAPGGVQAPAQNPGAAGVPPGFPNMGGMPDMSGPQGEQMKKMASDMMNNPEMLQNMMNMFTNDPNGPLMQMLKQQFPNTNPATLAKCMKIISYFILMFAYLKQAWSYTVVKIFLF